MLTRVPSATPSTRTAIGCVVLFGAALLAMSACQSRSESSSPPPVESEPVEASSWEWTLEDGDAFASFKPSQASGKRFGMDLTSSSRLWVGCFDRNRAFVFSLTPTPSTFEISRDGNTWERPKLRNHGPYGLAGHVYPGLQDVDAFMQTLDKPLFARWKMSGDRETYKAAWNLSGWKEAESRAAGCGPWPE